MVKAYPKTRFIWSPVALAMAIVMFPYSLTKIDFRKTISPGLIVSVHKSSPAYAAFEDLTLNFVQSSEQHATVESTRLASGKAFNIKALQEFPRPRILNLKGVVVRAPVPQPTVVAAAPEAFQASPFPEHKKVLIEKLKAEDWSIPSPAQMAHELAAQELAKMGAMAPPVSSNVDESPQMLASIDYLNPIPSASGALVLKGQIEMTGGLAYIGPETNIRVKRVLEGIAHEQGRIWINEGRFEIQVKNAAGFLVGELVTRDGKILGRGEISLLKLQAVVPLNGHIDDIRLALRPTAEVAALRGISGYSHGDQKIPVADARIEIENITIPSKVNDEGVLIEPVLTRGSSFIARAEAPQHWASVVVGQSIHPQEIRLFSDSMVEALLGLELKGIDQKEARFQSIVWGQVVKDGRPIEGAVVQMAGSYEPIYFNQAYLPDQAMVKTGPNGMFAFLKVRSGVQAARVLFGGRTYPAQIFPTENKNISWVELQLRDQLVSEFRVFDVFDSGREVAAQVRLVGAEEALSIQSKQWLEYSVAADPFMVEVDAGPEYELARMTLTGAPYSTQIPLVKREWLYKLLTQKQIALLPGRGIVAGFVDDQDFEIELTGYAPGEQMQIIYFDAKGVVLDSLKGGAGGGFIVPNAPLGLQTLFIYPFQSREVYSQVFVAEPQYVHVVTWDKFTSRR